MKKLFFTVAVLAILAFAAYVGWRAYQKVRQGSQSRRPGGPGVIAVEVAPVRPATLYDRGRFTGSLAPQSRFLVAPRVGGRLVKLAVNIGDTVPRGKEIAWLDDQEFAEQEDRAQAELAVAEATVAECETTFQTALREFERIGGLWQKKFASDLEYEQAVAQYEVQEARCRVAKAQVLHKAAALREAKLRRSYTTISATWADGTGTRLVGERFVDEGALLTANAPIVSIIDISTLTAAVYVIERDYAKIAIDQPAKVTTDAYPNRTFTGQVARVAPQLQETSRQGRVEITVDNPGGLLKPGMFVRVELTFDEHKNVPAVPPAALVRRDGRQGVFVADAAAGKVRFVPVETGIASLELVEVVRPILDGPVVVMGQHLLQHGSAIRIVASSPPPTTRPDQAATRPDAGEAGP